MRIRALVFTLVALLPSTILAEPLTSPTAVAIMGTTPSVSMSYRPQKAASDGLQACRGFSSCGQYNASYGRWCARNEVVCFNPFGNGVDECVITCRCTGGC